MTLRRGRVRQLLRELAEVLGIVRVVRRVPSSRVNFAVGQLVLPELSAEARTNSARPRLRSARPSAGCCHRAVAEDGGGRVFDRHRVAEPRRRCLSPGWGEASCFVSARFAGDVGGRVSTEDQRRGPVVAGTTGAVSSSSCSRVPPCSHTTWNGSLPSVRPFWSL